MALTKVSRGLLSTSIVDNGNATAITIDSSENVGIGTSSPSRPLTVNGFAHFGSTDCGVTAGDNGGVASAYALNAEGTVYKPFEIRTGAAGTGFYQATSGNVGIGTSSPSRELEVTGSGNVYLKVTAPTSSDSVGIELANTGATWLIQNVDYSSDALAFSRAGTERMRINSSGNVGIGTSNPTAKLHIEKQANLNEAAPHFAIKGAGYVGSHWLDGNAYYIGQNSTVRRMRIYSGSESSGVNLSNGQTSWGTFSDERLKYDVEPVENAVESLSNLRTVKYRLKDVDSTEDKKKIGLMAQDLVGVLDEVIDPVKKTGDDTEYMSVRYTELMPVLVKAIQEQQTLIESLTARIAALEE